MQISSPRLPTLKRVHRRFPYYRVLLLPVKLLWQLRVVAKHCRRSVERQLVGSMVKAMIANYFRDTFWEFRAIRKQLHLFMAPAVLAVIQDELNFRVCTCGTVQGMASPCCRRPAAAPTP